MDVRGDFRIAKVKKNNINKIYEVIMKGEKEMSMIYHIGSISLGPMAWLSEYEK